MFWSDLSLVWTHIYATVNRVITRVNRRQAIFHANVNLSPNTTRGLWIDRYSFYLSLRDDCFHLRCLRGPYYFGLWRYGTMRCFAELCPQMNFRDISPSQKITPFFVVCYTWEIRWRFRIGYVNLFLTQRCQQGSRNAFTMESTSTSFHPQENLFQISCCEPPTHPTGTAADEKSTDGVCQWQVTKCLIFLARTLWTFVIILRCILRGTNRSLVVCVNHCRRMAFANITNMQLAKYRIHGRWYFKCIFLN